MCDHDKCSPKKFEYSYNLFAGWIRYEYYREKLHFSHFWGFQGVTRKTFGLLPSLPLEWKKNSFRGPFSYRDLRETCPCGIFFDLVCFNRNLIRRAWNECTLTLNHCSTLHFWVPRGEATGTVSEKEKSQTNTKVFFLASCIYKCKYILSNFYSSVALTQQTRKTRF